MMSPNFYINLLKDKWIRRKYTRHSLTTGRGSVILMFHHIADVCPDGISSSCYSSVLDFEDLITKLKNTKSFISLSELCGDLERGIIPIDKVVMTFDDVPSDMYKNALPILRKYEIPFTLYISTGLIGKDGFLTKEQIVELSEDSLCTIGSHTVSHCILKNKDADLQNEFLDSKRNLEILVKKPVEHFAYPYGTPFAISKKVVKRLKDTGLYRSAVCTIPAYINKYSVDNMYSLPRIHSQLFVDKYF